jgi:ethanolamine utilization protein EutN
MRIARVLGNLTLDRKLDELPGGALLLVEAMDRQALNDPAAGRAAPMSESLVVFDALGAARGQLIALSEGREAAVPFHPRKVPIDAYNAAILDEVAVGQ